MDALANVNPVSWHTIIGLSLLMFFYGIYCSLLTWFIAVARKTTTINTFLRVAACLSFILTSFSVASKWAEVHAYVSAPDADSIDINLLTIAGTMLNWSQYFQYIVSDTVLIWRLYAISGHSIRKCAIPIGFEIVAIIIGFIRWVSWSIWYNPCLDVESAFLTEGDLADGYVTQPVLGVLWYFFLMFTNLSATILLARQISKHRKEVQAAFGGPTDARHRYYDFLSILFLESGVAFTLWVLLEGISSIVSSLGPGNIVKFGNTILSLSTIIPALYPLSIILLSEYGKHIIVAYTPTSSLRFDNQDRTPHNDVESGVGATYPRAIVSKPNGGGTSTERDDASEMGSARFKT